MSAGSEIGPAALTVGTSATLLVNPRMRRDSVIIQNLDSAAISVGTSAVTMTGATAGLSIPANGTVTLDTFTGVLYGISTAGTAANAVRVFEVF